MSGSAIIVLILTLVWQLIRGAFAVRHTLSGLVLGTAFVLLTGAGRGRRIALKTLPRRVFWFCVFFFAVLPFDILRSNLALARRLLRRDPGLRSGIVRLKLKEAAEPVEALEEHAITLSPGQLVVDYSPDRQTVYIHMIDVTQEDEMRRGPWKRYRMMLRKVFQ